MKAIGFTKSLPLTEADSFIEFETATPVPAGHELLIKVKAAGINPVDFKVRQNSAKDKVLETPKIIGWDAVGVVEAIGENVRLFKKGDEVYYAGDITKPGSYARYQLVDERIAGRKPSNLSDAEAAAIPLTALTAWEIMFDRMRIGEKDKGKTILIIGGAGGVGSIAIQIAKKVAGLQVITTASRPESIQWCLEQGADTVVNHKDLVNEVRNAGFQQVDFILDFVDVNQYWDAFAELIKPQGSIGSISDPAQPVNLRQLKSKSVSFHWELMFTRSMFGTEDIEEQHNILTKVAKLLEEGVLTSTLRTTLHGFSVDNFKKAQQRQESGSTIGKTVVVFE
ncbi:MAG: zinc-binding alcohol dehydrogenase family protein [Ferruginibacter sp.]